MRTWTLLGIVWASALSAFATAETSPSQTPRDLSAELREVVARTRVPGLVAAVVQGDQIVALGAAGVRKAGANAALTVDDKFLLCSGTKPMTATLVGLAVQEGRLGWETTLGEVFSASFPRMHPEWRTATIKQLLNHRAGVPNEGGRIWTLLGLHFSHRTAGEKRRALVEKILSRPPLHSPGSRYVYTALDYVILGVILEQSCGRVWEDLMQQQLWEPLDIATGGFGAPGSRRQIDQPRGHWGMLWAGRPTKPGGFWARLSMPEFMGPGGAAHMTIGDWAKFVSAHLRGDPANPHHQARLLEPTTFAALHQGAPKSFYESGWILQTQPWAKGSRAGDTGRVIASQGDNGFWHTEAWLAPELDVAVLVICNQGGAAPQKPAARACAEVLRQLTRALAPKS